jgi:hypothetical protein
MAAEDRYLTYITEARSDAEAMGIIAKVKPSAVRAMADLLYIEADGHGIAWLRNAVVNEARA